jgi:hypothetical protein
MADYSRLRFSVLDREIVVTPGEALLPVIVLVGCGIYYGGTRGLPDQSMVYAGPLLYGTAALAVITLVQHTFSIGGKDDKRPAEERTVASAADAAETTGEPDGDTESGSQNEQFNRYTAAGLVALSTGYVFSLGVLGFVLPTVGFLAALVALFGERRPAYIVTYSVVLTAVTWAVFIYWLNIPL